MRGKVTPQYNDYMQTSLSKEAGDLQYGHKLIEEWNIGAILYEKQKEVLPMDFFLFIDFNKKRFLLIARCFHHRPIMAIAVA